MKDDWVALLDCNNFFVSCERLFRPELKNKPVIVLSSNDGCVVARSQEVKDMGVPMGVPYFKIKDIIKDKGITTFSSHLALYRDISRRVFSVMRNNLNLVEQYSIDEAFFRISGESLEEVNWVKYEVERSVGIPVSVGVAKTKTLAKLANTYAKKGSGIYRLDNDEDWLEISKNIPLAKIWGVGGGLEMRYKNHSILTVFDLLSADRDRVSKLFGVGGVRLKDELSGVRVFPLGSVKEPQKTILSSRSFKKETKSIDVLADSVAYHVRHAVADLRSMQMKARGVRVSIHPSRYGDFVLKGGSKEVVLNSPTNDSIEIMKLAQRILKDLFEDGVPYKKAGITLSLFSPDSVEQPNLFDKPSDSENNSKLMGIIDSLNSKSSKELVVLGGRFKEKSWRPRLEERSPAYTTNWNDIATVSAKT